MPTSEETEARRDGFIVRELASGKEVSFVACAKGGRMRETSLAGLLRNMAEQFYVEDTREATHA